MHQPSFKRKNKKMKAIFCFNLFNQQFILLWEYAISFPAIQTSGFNTSNSMFFLDSNLSLLIVQAASSNVFLQHKTQVCESGILPPCQLGTIDFFAFDFLTIRRHIFYHHKFKISSGQCKNIAGLQS